MTSQERGLILLCSRLGCIGRPVLTPNMMKTVQTQVAQTRQNNAHRYLTTEELLKMGLQPALAGRVIGLMGDHMILESYLRQAERLGCVPLTPFTPGYPKRLWAKLGYEGPCCLWAKGNLELLNRPAMAVVGSRDPQPAAAAFAQEAGRAIARKGYVLVSGNARGVDQLAQNACLAAGGAVISVVADTLYDKQPHDRILYLSENDYDLGFSSGRALSRNHTIHAMAELTFVSQCREGRGGTWSGSYANLKNKWSPIACFHDGTPGAQALEQLGARLVTVEELERLVIDN